MQVLLEPIRPLSPATTAGPRTADGSTATRQTDTPAAGIAAAEHGRVAQHVRDNKEAHMRATDVDLFEVGDTAVASSHGDIFELDVHVILGCGSQYMQVVFIWRRILHVPSSNRPR